MINAGLNIESCPAVETKAFVPFRSHLSRVLSLQHRPSSTDFTTAVVSICTAALRAEVARGVAEADSILTGTAVPEKKVSVHAPFSLGSVQEIKLADATRIRIQFEVRTLRVSLAEAAAGFAFSLFSLVFVCRYPCEDISICVCACVLCAQMKMCVCVL